MNTLASQGIENNVSMHNLIPLNLKIHTYKMFVKHYLTIDVSLAPTVKHEDTCV